MKPFIHLVFLTLMLASLSVSAQDLPAPENKLAMKEFVRSCTYGVLAGTLVGAATLAFTEQPGENINKVARGASLGLYAGILLGLYVVYVVPNQVPAGMDPFLEDPSLAPGEYSEPYDDVRWRWDAFPLIGQHGFEGAALGLDFTF